MCPFPEVVRGLVREDSRGSDGCRSHCVSTYRHPRAKSEANVSMKTEVTAARFSSTVRRLQLAEGDLRGVGRLVGDVSPGPRARGRSRSR